MASSKRTRPVLVCTAYKGVFAGLAAQTAKAGGNITLDRCRMAIAFGTERGVLELADTGPTASSKISAPADDVHLSDVTLVASLTDEAWQKWNQ